MGSSLKLPRRQTKEESPIIRLNGTLRLVGEWLAYQRAIQSRGVVTYPVAL